MAGPPTAGSYTCPARHATRQPAASTQGMGLFQPSEQVVSGDADAGPGSSRRNDTVMVDSVVAFALALCLLVIVLRYSR
jgi:hypothetical protein